MHNLTSQKNRATKKRVGRGGKRGKTSGHGHKGQNQHGGHGKRPELRDIIKRIPKLRGHGKNRGRTIHVTPDALAVNLAQIEEAFSKGGEVNPQSLVEAGLVSSLRKAQKHGIKILGHGNLTQKITVSDCAVSASATEKITKAGGSVK